jgi:hypothetical protein
VDRARARRRQADIELARELGVRTRHERPHLLASDLHELERVARAIERTDDPVDAIAGMVGTSRAR